MFKGGLSAIVPVRAGSKRLKNKNILPFGESNLLIHKIRQLKKVRCIDEIIVSSDSDEMLEMAFEENCLTHKRELIFADEKTKSFSEVVVYLAQNAGSKEHILYAPCVCPLCDENDFTQALNVYQKILLSKEFDSVISIKSFKEYLWDEEKPINYTLGVGHVPSQNLPDFEVVVNGFYVAPRQKMIEWKYFFGPKPYRFKIDTIHAIDIDTNFDYLCARLAYDMSMGGGGSKNL